MLISEFLLNLSLFYRLSKLIGKESDTMGIRSSGIFDGKDPITEEVIDFFADSIYNIDFI